MNHLKNFAYIVVMKYESSCTYSIKGTELTYFPNLNKQLARKNNEKYKLKNPC